MTSLPGVDADIPVLSLMNVPHLINAQSRFSGRLPCVGPYWHVSNRQTGSFAKTAIDFVFKLL